MARQEVINIGQCRRHAHAQRLVALVFQMRVKPDYFFKSPFKKDHLAAKHIDIAPVPPVAQDYQCSVPCDVFPSVATAKLLKTATDVRAP